MLISEKRGHNISLKAVPFMTENGKAISVTASEYKNGRMEQNMKVKLEISFSGEW
jgi:hypothetical protein